MHLSKKIRVATAILITLFITTNTTISNEININKTEIIDEKDFKTDNIDININRDELVMNDNISNNNKNIQADKNANEGTITNKTGMFTMVKDNNTLNYNNTVLTPNIPFKTDFSLPTKQQKINVTDNTSKDELSHPDLVINYAAINSSDMKIENINTNGKVILIVDKETELDKPVKRYNMFNISSSQINQQDGISLTPQKLYTNSDNLKDDIKIINTGGSSISIEKITPPTNTTIEKRQYLRFKTTEMEIPINIETTENTIKLIDISRAGAALSHQNTLKVNDIVPIRLQYKDVDITTHIKILDASNKRASGKFIDEDKSISNRLLYLSVLLEADNKMLATRFSK